jgi:predicted nucleic acid-binding protein
MARARLTRPTTRLRATDHASHADLAARGAGARVAAARLFRALGRQGVTVRGAVDCIIAQTCIAADAELLSGDRDFAAIARRTPLRLCTVGR